MHVVVIGSGIVGLTTAQALLADGHAVSVVDRHAMPAMGASHANGGFLSASHCAPWAAPGMARMAMASMLTGRGPVRWKYDGTLAQVRWLLAMLRQCDAAAFSLNRERMIRLARHSRDSLRQVRHETGIGFDGHEAGSLSLISDAARQDAAKAQVAELRSHRFDAVLLDRDALLAREPGLADAQPSVVGAVLVRDDGAGDCEQFCRALREWLQTRGVQFHYGSTVERIEHSAGRFTGLRLDSGLLKAEGCVVAAGADAPALLRGIARLPVCPVKGYSFTVDVTDESAAPHGNVLDDVGRLAIARLGRRIRVAGVADVVGHDVRLEPGRQRQMLARFRQLYPRAADLSAARFWAGLRPMTSDGPPLIGATPVQGLYVNTGHGTYGWTMSCGSARLLAAIVAGRTPPVDAADYALPRPSR